MRAPTPVAHQRHRLRMRKGEAMSEQTPMEGLIKEDSKRIPNRCEGWRRRGGVFTLGPVVWEQCDQRGLVRITFIDNGKNRTLPACARCWNECIETGLEIIKTVPITKTKRAKK